MLHTDAQFSEKVEAVVAEIERKTDAEIVVVAAARSGSYDDLVANGAAAAALLAFLALVLMPFQVNPILGMVDLVGTFLLARFFLDAPWFLRRVAGAERKRAQVDQAAAAEFHFEAVHSTPGRKALLIYVSALEGAVELIPDVGLEARIPRGRWADATAEFAHDDLEHFIRGMAKVGDLLASEVPHTGSERLDLANAPRIRN